MFTLLLVLYCTTTVSVSAAEGFQETINFVLSSEDTIIRDSDNERSPGSSLTGKKSLDKVFVTRVGIDWVMIHRIGGEITIMRKDDYEDSLNKLITQEREDTSNATSDSNKTPSNLQND